MRRRIQVEDPWGGRWKVRVRRERFAQLETERSWRQAEPALRERLGQALAPRPGPLAAEETRAHVVVGPKQLFQWAIRLAAVVVAVVAAPTMYRIIEAVVALVVLIAWLDARANPMWLVELVAESGLRRRATWKVTGRHEGDRVAPSVADAVRAGQPPQPEGAVLISVVDERRPALGVAY
jgi:hypothetical protein